MCLEKSEVEENSKVLITKLASDLLKDDSCDFQGLTLAEHLRKLDIVEKDLDREVSSKKRSRVMQEKVERVNAQFKERIAEMRKDIGQHVSLNDRLSLKDPQSIAEMCQPILQNARKSDT